MNNEANLTNVTFAGNHAVEGGGGMYNSADTEPVLTNVIFWGNTAQPLDGLKDEELHSESGSTPTITYSLVRGQNPPGEGNLDGTTPANNPLFVDPPESAKSSPHTAGDVRLQIGSPAINTGDPNTDLSLFPDGPGNPTDLDGNPRVFSGNVERIDMGAYEFQGETQGDLNFTLTLSEGWRMLSSPFDGLTYNDIIGQLWTQGFPGSDAPSAEFANVYTWSNDQSGSDPGDWAPLPDQGNPIPAGTGFLIQVYGDDNYDGTVEASEEFDKTILLDGPVRTGDISPPMNSTSGGWTLVGNPYSDPIDFSNVFSSSSSGLTGAAYVYDPNGDPTDNTNGNPGGWRSTDGAYGDLTSGIIAAGQGFFVQNSGSSGSITFTEASQTTGGQFYGKQKELRDFVRLEVQGEAGVNSAWIRFSEEGSNEQMYGDALELQPYTEQYTLLGARKADGTMLDIAHFPLPDEQTQIPLSMSTTQSGTYTLSATDLDLPTGTQLYLHDRKTGKSALMDEGFEYSFVITEGQESKKQLSSAQASRSTVAGGPQKAMTAGNDRFLITTTPELPTTEIPEEVALGQNYPNPFNPATVISYQLPVSSDVRLEVYDMLGRRVATLVDATVEAGEHQVSFQANHLTSGVYLYRLAVDGPNGANQIFTKKLTLIK